MRRAFALAVLVVSVTAGVARADVYAESSAPAAPVQPAAPAQLPSAAEPNAPGTVMAVPFNGDAVSLSYPQLVDLWQRAGSAYGIPWYVLGAINKVETGFGQNMGPSSAGAIGWMQFMPSTWEMWGVDADGNGIADPWNPEDAVFAAARYLAASGGGTDVPRAVFSYNHSQAYVDEVLGIAGELAGGTAFQGDLLGSIPTPAPTFAIDQVATRISAAQDRVAAASRRLRAAQAVERRAAAKASGLLARSDAAPLLSDRLSLQRLATLAGVEDDARAAVVARLRTRLDQAHAALEDARSTTAFSPLAPGAPSLGAAPVAAGRYVFPVGGGPSQVSVGHTHHDYPAADIAAPEGTPLYALTNMSVLEAWHIPNGNCGIGFTAQAWDGHTYTYCHLSFLEPSVLQDAPLAAGQPVGRVGHTGHATGPHLHLQLHPATGYPQDLPWFASFAGTAFRWQDAATPTSTAPTFAVVPTDSSDGGVITFTTAP